MANSDIHPLRFARMHLRESGGLGTAWKFKASGIAVAEPTFIPSFSITFHRPLNTLAAEEEGDDLESEEIATTAGLGPKFGLSSILGLHTWSNTECDGILCVSSLDQQQESMPASYADFLAEDRMSRRQSGFGQCRCSESEFPARTRRARRTMSSQSTWGTKENLKVDDGASNFKRVRYTAGLRSTKISGSGEHSKCTCKPFLICPSCGKPQHAQLQAQSTNNSSENNCKFADLVFDGRNGESEWIRLYHETVTSFDSQLGVTMSRHVRARTGDEPEILIAGLITRCCRLGAHAPSLTNRDSRCISGNIVMPSSTFGLGELETQTSKQCGLVFADEPALHSACSPPGNVGFDVDLDQRFTEVTPYRYSSEWQGVPSRQCEKNILTGCKGFPQAAPIDIFPKHLRKLNLSRSLQQWAPLDFGGLQQSAELDFAPRFMLNLSENLQQSSEFDFAPKFMLNLSENLQQSAPIVIPKRKSILSDEDAALTGERISYAYPMTQGRGRTLKGRDLVQFRNYVLRSTGFIEEGC